MSLPSLALMVLTTELHFSAPTAVVALENTLNGTIIPQSEAISISNWVHSNGMIMHLDGARLWHVAIQSGMGIKELCDPFDSVSLCLSKGLGGLADSFHPLARLIYWG